ncbi:MAG: Serine-tRNA ligase [Parcubacteria group bacterium GW2011_GWF2_39_8b]|nr:MAG: Serine-tRNA ligase [Parcubacteria group bacterium GW2011_GWF2_39_8b]
MLFYMRRFFFWRIFVKLGYMLDIKFIRENKDIVASAIKNKNRDVDLDILLELSDRRKSLKQEIDNVNQGRNEAAKSRDVEKGTQLKKELEMLEKDFNEIDKQFFALMAKVPNIPSPDTPIGKDESSNKVMREWGTKPQFDFEPKEHDELGKALGILDIETAGEISGSRFAYIKGDLALLQFTLLQFCFSILTNKEQLKSIAKEKNVQFSIGTFVPIIPPVFIKPAVQNRMARFMTPEEHYMFQSDDLMLIGSAEHTLGPLYMDKILEEKDLPIRLVGYSTAFRREAGSHGKDTKGIIRQHQFDKLEMETFCLPENSLQEQEFLVAIQEHILQSLDLPYQVVAICTGDMAFPDYRQIDIETWMPGQNRYRETHSADLTASFQSRRLNTRVRRNDGKIEPLHMNDATAVAMGRMLVAIMENYQQADGSIKIPEVLRTYMGGQQIISKK